MFLDQVIGLLELFKCGIKIDGLVNKCVLDKVSGSLLVLALVCEYLSDEPLLVECPHLVHLVCQVAQVNELEVTNAHESFPRQREVLCEEGLNAECSPVLFGDTDARDLVSH